ncbi:MAG: lamin tail domain-containing protein [Candidatus Bipolaricaulia bacterium]
MIPPTDRWLLVPLLGAVLLLGVALGRPAHAQFSLAVDIPDRTVSPGDTVTVPIRIDNLDQVGDVKSYGFDIGLNKTAVSYAGFTATNTLSGAANFTVRENPDIPRIGAFFSSKPLNAVADEGVLLRLTFAVKDTGTHALSLEDLRFSGGEVPADPPAPTFALTGNSLTINEVLTAPPAGPEGDANGDGTRDAQEDEFIELYNTSSTEAMKLGGLALRTASGGRQHVFPEGTSVGPESGLVVFGGGAPANSLPSPTQTASSGGLGLADDGTTVRLVDTAVVTGTSKLKASGTGASDDGVLSFEYDGSVTGESMTRDPEFTGDFVPHTQVSDDPFSPARTASGDALPVELVSFTGTVTGQRVRLRWTTASETNNAGFRVQHRPGDRGRTPPERETEAKDWRTLTFVESTARGGTTAESTTYRVSTEPLRPGPHHFRLVQVDHDGTRHRSDPVAVTVQMEEDLRLSAPSPHPVSQRATLFFAVRAETEVRLALYDVLGRLQKHVYRGTPPAATAQRVRLNAADLASGVYVLRLAAGGRTETRRMVVAR